VIAEGHGLFDGLDRGATAELVREDLVQAGDYRGEEDVAEEVLRSRWGDIVTVLRREEVSGHVRQGCQQAENLRSSFLMVSRPGDDTIISLSADVNVSAVDNKVTAALTGRTGAFCTACRARSTDMHGPRAAEPYYMDFDIEEVTLNYHALFEKLLGSNAADGTLPSAKGDHDTRLGQKHQPLTTEWDPTKVCIGTYKVSSQNCSHYIISV
jgi:hypothetical protein